MPPTTPGGPGDVAARLQRLRSLLDQGLITQEEHDTRRQAIIDSV